MFDSENEIDASDNTMDIETFVNSNFDNNCGQCPYCPKNNLSSVAIHIGHMHKCKNCRELIFKCKCSKSSLIYKIRSFQTSSSKNSTKFRV